MVTLWSALVLGCLMVVRSRRAESAGATSADQRGVDGSAVGHRPPARPGARVQREVRLGAAVTTVYRPLINLARGTSRDPSPA